MNKSTKLSDLLKKMHQLIVSDIKTSEKAILSLANMSSSMVTFDTQALNSSREELQEQLNILAKHHEIREQLAGLCGFTGRRAQYLLLQKFCIGKNVKILDNLQTLETNLKKIKAVNLQNGNLLAEQQRALQELKESNKIVVRG